jgi:transposase
MDQVHVIRHKVLVEGASIRGVASALGISRNTVAKYLDEPAPQRRASTTRSAPSRDLVRERIAELIKEWRPRTTRKQRITGSRLHRQLVEEGYGVGKTTVYEVLREHRRQLSEVFIPLVHRAGDAAQVDFFEVTVETAGERRTVWKFVMRLMHSGYDFVWLYERCDQLAFLDAHVRAFAHFNGVPARCIYDNLSAAVHRKVSAFSITRKLTERFSALSSHYLFEPCFARPGEGHDKGGVEARGKGIRLQHLTPIPEGKTLHELATVLLGEVTRHAAIKHDTQGKSVTERFREEHVSLRALPAVAFNARHTRLVTVSRQATVQVEGATYSVPSTWARLEATAHIGVEDIRFTCRGEQETHPRQPSGGKSVRYRHYLPELAHKPQAVRQVAPELVAELGEPYGRLWQLLVAAHGGLEAGRVLARVLGAIGAHGEATITAALSAALAHAGTQSGDIPEQMPLTRNAVPTGLRFYEVEEGRAADYDWLLAEPTPMLSHPMMQGGSR